MILAFAFGFDASDFQILRFMLECLEELEKKVQAFEGMTYHNFSSCHGSSRGQMRGIKQDR